MRRIATPTLLLAPLLMGWLGPHPPAAAQCMYDVASAAGPNCGSPWGLASTQGTAINSFGVAVGMYRMCPFDDEYCVAIRWTKETGLVPLTGFPAGTLSTEAYDINDAGQITGYYCPPEPGFREIGFLIEGDTFTSLGTLPNGNFSAPAAINEAGDIVGTAGNFVTGPVVAFLWRNGKMQELAGLPGVEGFATDINDRGQVVGGYYLPGESAPRAFLWEDGAFTDIGVIPGGFWGFAAAINVHGHVLGQSRLTLPNGDDASHSFLWIDGVMTVIEHLHPVVDSSSAASCAALDINDSDQVLLNCRRIWQDGVVTNLEDLVPEEVQINTLKPRKISNDGVLVGRARLPVGDPDLSTRLAVFTPQAPLTDLTDDCRTDAADLAILLGNWGPVPPNDPIADFNDDGVVDAADLAILLGNWG